MIKAYWCNVQHALALFRSQRINKMTLDHKKDEDKLSVTVLSENGAPSSQLEMPTLLTVELQINTVVCLAASTLRIPFSVYLS